MRIPRKILRSPWLIAGGLAVAVTAWMLSGQNAQPVPASEASHAPAEDQAPVPSVQARVQIAEEVTRYVTVYGRTAPARVVELKAETSGRVVATGVRRGGRVGKGEVIVELDGRDRQARLRQARATVRQRELEYEAQKPLAEQGFITEAQLAEGAANLEGARAELRRAELDLQYMVVRAPFDGALHERLVEVGDYVERADPIAEFVDDRTLIVTGSLAEKEAYELRPGAVASAELVTGQKVSGRIRYVSPVADVATRTFEIELELPNADGALPAGVTAEMHIPIGTVLAQKISPALLTLDDDGTLGVKVVDPLGRVAFYPADIAKSESDGVWVAGLPNSSTVITVGQGFVKTGEPVDAQIEAPRSRTANAGEAGESL